MGRGWAETKRLGKMKDKPLRIKIDTREQLPYQFSKFLVEIQHEALPAGDYSVAGFEDKIAIERKSLNDLIGCLMGDNRARFERELAKARSYELFVVIVEANFCDISAKRYQSKILPHSVHQSLIAFTVRYPLVRFIFAGSRDGGEYVTYSLLEKYVQEIEKRYSALCKAKE